MPMRAGRMEAASDLAPVLPTRIAPSAKPAALSPGRVAREFQRRLEAGLRLRPAGDARDDPESLLAEGYTPKLRVDLFDTVFYLTNVRENEDLRFFVAYVLQETPERPARDAWPRIFYKDLSLVWRSASHVVRTAEENWIGKGDVKPTVIDGEEVLCSAESTTDLPLEMLDALEVLSRRLRRIPYDDLAPELVLRNGPADRVRPYRDFLEPRRRAAANPANRVNGGAKVAWFEEPGVPDSLRFAPGFEPDFDAGLLEHSTSRSSLYGGEIGRHRILSRNRRIQYLFLAGPRHVWIIPPQALTTELSTFGVRTVDVEVDDDLCIPGFEYHFVNGDGEHTAEEDGDGNGSDLASQIPAGYAGAKSEHDPTRADASPWLDALPVVREFRAKILRR